MKTDPLNYLTHQIFVAIHLESCVWHSSKVDMGALEDSEYLNNNAMTFLMSTTVHFQTKQNNDYYSVNNDYYSVILFPSEDKSTLAMI